ncbi:MAG: aspartyl/glutamyl-tRNA(Asn/Gln) amidotransferase subunit C [Candidatus Binatia bacterium]|nr:MAG: aspartyl/glutamyl-tRNA(Asn/Gln) amidotransferase subunit C [Candidatus Binatia bacterium]
MILDRAVVRSIAHLARLELSAAEEEQYLTQLEHILEYFETLSEVETTGVEPATDMVEAPEIFRADVVTNGPAEEEFLSVAPARFGRFFRVPKIIE